MGLVIKAHNMAIDEHVAMKLLRDDINIDEANIERFIREAKNAVKLKSEHVAKIKDVGTFQDGRPYMVMELLEGADLGHMLLDQGRLERTRAVDLVLQACDALAEAHSLGIVHRDIKPTNLFVSTRRDGTDLLKVLDFGISKARAGPEMSLTQTSSMLGTPAYMSPEQMRSARGVDPRSDIWSLGTVLYELVEGRPPFDAQNFAELCVMVATEPYAPMRMTPELTPVIDRCLAKNIAERYQDIAELAYDLQAYSSEPERARRSVGRIFRILGVQHPDSRDSTPGPYTLTRNDPSSISVPIRLPTPTMPVLVVRRPWKTIVLLLLLCGVGIGVGVWAMTQQRDPEPQASGAPADSQPTTAVESPPDAAVATEVDAGTAAGRAPIERVEPETPAVTVKKPAVKKPTVKKPTVKKPAVKKEPASGSGAPLKPKCDPFDNPKGCTS